VALSVFTPLCSCPVSCSCGSCGGGSCCSARVAAALRLRSGVLVRSVSSSPRGRRAFSLLRAPLPCGVPLRRPSGRLVPCFALRLLPSPAAPRRRASPPALFALFAGFPPALRAVPPAPLGPVVCRSFFPVPGRRAFVLSGPAAFRRPAPRRGRPSPRSAAARGALGRFAPRAAVAALFARWGRPLRRAPGLPRGWSSRRAASVAQGGLL
jgi:hypothetical protein